MELHAIQLDVTSERSADAAISSIFREGQRPFRVYVDPAQEGGEVVGGVADRIRAEFLRRIGLEDLLTTNRTPRAERTRACRGHDRTSTATERSTMPESTTLPSSTLTEQEIRAITTLYQAFTDHNPDLLDSVCAPNWQDIPLARPVKGRDRMALKI